MSRSKMSDEERRERRKETTARYRKRNRDKILAYRLATKEAKRLQDAAWRAANPNKRREYRKANIVKIREQTRARREANKDFYDEMMRRWRQKNRDRIIQYRKDYWAANAARLLAEQRAKRRANPEIGRKQALKWAKDNPEKAAILTARRRARKAGVLGNFTITDWSELVARSPFCYWCKRSWTKKRRPTHDHIIPITKDGSNTPENSVCACRECNSAKGNRLFHPVNGQGILL